jgi:hypothetical protein
VLYWRAALSPFHSAMQREVSPDAALGLDGQHFVQIGGSPQQIAQQSFDIYKYANKNPTRVTKWVFVFVFSSKAKNPTRITWWGSAYCNYLA